MKPDDPKRTTPFERFEDAVRKVVSVPKSEIDKRLKEQKKAREDRKKRD